MNLPAQFSIERTGRSKAVVLDEHSNGIALVHDPNAASMAAVISLVVLIGVPVGLCWAIIQISSLLEVAHPLDLDRQPLNVVSVTIGAIAVFTLCVTKWCERVIASPGAQVRHADRTSGRIVRVRQRWMPKWGASEFIVTGRDSSRLETILYHQATRRTLIYGTDEVLVGLCGDVEDVPDQSQDWSPTHTRRVPGVIANLVKLIFSLVLAMGAMVMPLIGTRPARVSSATWFLWAPDPAAESGYTQLGRIAWARGSIFVKTEPTCGEHIEDRVLLAVALTLPRTS